MMTIILHNGNNNKNYLDLFTSDIIQHINSKLKNVIAEARIVSISTKFNFNLVVSHVATPTFDKCR